MRVLDLFCGAGGASRGYELAGFTEIVGVDVKKQNHYPYEFRQRDAIQFLEDYFLEDWPEEYRYLYKHFDFIHASPPCQKFSTLNKVNKREYPDFISKIRELLNEIGIPYIIENVPNSPLVKPVQLCGGYFDLGIPGYYLKRHRWFESNLDIKGTPCNHFEKYAVGVYGHGPWNNNHDAQKDRGGYQANAAEKAQALGIDWMNRNELSQAIPPAYTEYLGKQVIAQLT